MFITFIETEIFIRSLEGLATEDEVRALQNQLLRHPEAGKLIRGGGGIRKVRLSIGGTGKSSGARVIYLYKKMDEKIFLLLAYAKARKDTLSAAETSILRELAKRL